MAGLPRKNCCLRHQIDGAKLCKRGLGIRNEEAVDIVVRLLRRRAESPAPHHYFVEGAAEQMRRRGKLAVLRQPWPWFGNQYWAAEAWFDHSDPSFADRRGQ